MISLRDYDIARQLVEERARTSIHAQQLRRELRNGAQAHGKQPAYHTLLNDIGSRLAAWGTHLQQRYSPPEQNACCPHSTTC